MVCGTAEILVRGEQVDQARRQGRIGTILREGGRRDQPEKAQVGLKGLVGHDVLAGFSVDRCASFYRTPGARLIVSTTPKAYAVGSSLSTARVSSDAP